MKKVELLRGANGWILWCLFSLNFCLNSAIKVLHHRLSKTSMSQLLNLHISSSLHLNLFFTPCDNTVAQKSSLLSYSNIFRDHDAIRLLIPYLHLLPALSAITLLFSTSVAFFFYYLSDKTSSNQFQSAHSLWVITLQTS